MDALPGGWGATLRRRFRGTDWGGVAAWLLGFGLVVYLGLEGGGFDPLVHDRVGIAVWWLLLAAVLVGALPRRHPGPLAWAALALLAGLAAWTALSLAWTESADKTLAELARVATYLGVFALALFVRGRRGARRIVAAVGAGVAVIALAALLSRLQPGWFPGAAETGSFLSRERLAYPLDYWNALAALIAIGAPALLHVATATGSLLARALAAAALPALALTAFLTFGRGGIAAGLIGLLVFLAFTSDRLPRLATLLLAGGGGAVLIAAAVQREALREGFAGQLARQQGDELLGLTLVVCAVVGAAQATATVLLRERGRPGWTLVPPRAAALATAVGAAAVLAGGLAFGASGNAADAWDEFKAGDSPGRGVERLGSVAGLHRYDFWASAVDQSAGSPLNGTGAGTFEYWWAREGNAEGTIRDAHSLYLQTLGELGIVGLALLVGLVALVLAGGGRAVLRTGPRGRPQPAAALAGCVAFVLTVGFDWHWQVPVVPVTFLLLAAALLGSGAREERNRQGRPGALPLPLRLGFAGLALAAIAAIALPLTTASLLRESEAEARAGDLRGALEAARSAQEVQPGAGGPRLQQALVLEQMGELPAAAAAARAAAERERTNWRHWLVLSRIEAERGRVRAAVRAYRRARSLNPHHSLFAT